jgi:hypothetical protein
MKPNPYESPAYKAEEKPTPRIPVILIRVGLVTTLIGMSVFFALYAILSLYLGYAPFWFQVAGFVSCAMVPIGGLMLAVGLIWWTAVRFRGKK